MRYSIAFLLFMLLLTCATAPVIAQTIKVQVITKKIEKNFHYKEGYEVNIEGEKAEVNIQTWEKKEIQVVMELIAKHPDKAVAERDLELMKHLAQRVKNKIYLRNYLSSVEGKGKSEPEAYLSVKYTITLPGECPVYLKNIFGAANISSLTNRLRVNSEFSRIGLQNLKGSVEIKTRFGDLIGQNLDGWFNIQSRRSDLTLQNISGRFNIQAQYGTIRLFANDDLADLRLDAEKSEVWFYHPNPQFVGYSLSARGSEVNLPSRIDAHWLALDNGERKITFSPNREYYPKVSIRITFGNLHVEKRVAP
ncbi:MAG: hypothetical protein SH848_18985 [Saprospiraceae bacterium]|nr:hypothetical protein [Saprospiraceae bacterium]MDZ4706020.1 hypothetical protein [Saprospiraceae bacterium]